LPATSHGPTADVRPAAFLPSGTLGRFIAVSSTASPPDAARKIYFYRALYAPADGEEFGAPISRKKVCEAINKLVGTSGFYFEQPDDKATCGEVVSDIHPHKIKIYGIRRENLPSQDDGNGTIQDLALNADEGLAEAVHVRLYPSGIVAFESFYYGPRISRFESYLTHACNEDILLHPLIRHDVIDQALKYDEIRSVRIKFHPGSVSDGVADDLGLSPALDAADEFGADRSIEMVLRAETPSGGTNQSFLKRTKKLMLRATADGRDPDEIFENFEITGRENLHSAIESLNLLNTKFVREVSIPRQSVRHRALDSDAAFAALHQAYKKIKADLPKDGYAGAPN
jgi:hypothetical protein